MPPYHAIEWKYGTLVLLDQRKLPNQTVYVTLHTAEETAEAIRNMTIRGAPAIGVAAVYGLALEAQRPFTTLNEAITDIHRAAALLMAARPTAVNLAWAVERIVNYLE